MAQFENGAHYECIVIDCGMDESKTGKNPMILLNVRPIYKVRNFGLPDERTAPVEADSERTVRLVFGSEKQSEMNMRKLRQAGWDGQNFAGFDMKGMHIVCANTHSESKGKVYDNFDLPLPPLAAKPIDNTNAGAISKKMNALLAKELRMPAAPKRQPTSGPPAESSPGPSQKQTSHSAPDGENHDGGQEDDETPF